MSKAEQKKLVKEIARIAEKAFRRGFQQGFLAANGEMGEPVPSEEQVTNWRFSQDKETHAVGPPGTLWAGRKGDLIMRLRCELQNMPMIRQLLFQTEERAKHDDC